MTFPKDLTGVISMFTDLVTAVIPLLGAVAFLMFLYGIGRFIKAAGNEKELKDSKNLIIWGIIGMFALIMVWGIVSFVKSEFGFGGDVGIPQIRFK